MRLYFFPGNIFLGIILILFGLSAILREYGINIPFFRVFFALILIYLGLTMLLGKPIFRTNDNISLFTHTDITVTKNINEEYNIIFGTGEIDMSELIIEEAKEPIEVNVIFGNGVLKINKDQPVLIDASSAFGSVKMPEGNNIVFGDYTYQNEVEGSERKRIFIKASAVFGKLEIKSE